MAADFGKAIGTALRYAWSARRMLPFFVLGLIILVTLLFTAKAAIAVYPAHGAADFFSSLYFIQIMLVDAVVFVVAGLACIYFSGAIIDNSRHYYNGKDRQLYASYKTASMKYFSLLGATVLTALIAFLVGMIPILGIALMIIISWLFFYAMQAVVVTDKTAADSLMKSYAVFMDNKLNTILFWLLLGIINLVMLLVALIPLLIGSLPVLGPLLAMAKGASALAMLKAIENSLYGIFIGGIFTVAILSYLVVFETSAKTFFYMQLAKTGRSRKK